MQEIILHNFLIFALGILAGLVVAIGIDLFRFYFFRPRLEFGEDRPEVAENFICHSLVVRNIGRRVATRVSGFISFEQIQAVDILPRERVKFGKDIGLNARKFGVTQPETVYLTYGSIRPIDQEPLCWAAVDSRNQIDIYPNTSRLLDVCRFIPIENIQQIHIPSSLGWQALLVALRPGTYRVWITVTGIDTKPARQRITIEYAGSDLKLRRGWAE